MKTKTCPFCGETFTDSHGNSVYCPEKDCGYEARKKRTIGRYAVKSKQADPLWANEKILRETYYTHGGQTEIAPHDLEVAGFDFELNSEEKNVEGIIVFCMRNFGYSFLKNKSILIWKLK